MTILVTGVAGFIGSHLLDRLMSDGRRVVGVDNFDPFYDETVKKGNIAPHIGNPDFVFRQADIRDFEDMKKIIREHGIKKIVHLAARAGVRPSIEEPLLYQNVNIRGTLNLLELSRKYDIENFVFGSSSSVYGGNKKVPFSEDDPVFHPFSPYAASKMACELYCFNYSHLYNIPTSCLRFFTVYGPRQRPEMAIHKFTRLIDSGKPVPVFGDGASKRDYTYISDIVDGVVSALDKNFKFEVFNLGNSNTVELKYLISLIEMELGKKAKVQHLPDQPGDVPITYADISKARRLLGYEPKVPIEDGVKRFVEWYKNN